MNFSQAQRRIEKLEKIAPALAPAGPGAYADLAIAEQVLSSEEYKRLLRCVVEITPLVDLQAQRPYQRLSDEQLEEAETVLTLLAKREAEHFAC